MDDLVRWLGEQLDEEAELAASGETWSMFPEGDFGTPRVDVDYSIERVVAATRAWRAKHIALHDPARVLREINAKRQLLDDFVVTARIRDEAAARIKAAGDHPDSKDLETWDRAQREAVILEGPVKLAATPIADRPGYREEWRP